MDTAFINLVIDKIIKDQDLTEDWYNDFRLPKEYVEKMLVLGEKYKSIRWLALDIPKIEIEDIDEFKSIWKKESADVLRCKPDAAEPWTKEKHPLKESSSWNVASFKGLHLYNNEIMSPISEGSFTAKLYTGDNKQLKRLLEQVYDYFPIHTMFEVFIWQSTREIKPHRDRGHRWKCPTEFRVMLHDENEIPTLYVADIKDRDVHYIDCPEDTNSFCWSNGTQVHGSDYYDKKKWILCIKGAPHSINYDQLISRSIEKYKDKLNYKLL